LLVLTQNFQVPPENLTTQGYGEQYLKVNTQEANHENRRVTVRRITPLLQQQADVSTEATDCARRSESERLSMSEPTASV
jgi:hypothetical protein